MVPEILDVAAAVTKLCTESHPSRVEHGDSGSAEAYAGQNDDDQSLRDLTYRSTALSFFHFCLSSSPTFRKAQSKTISHHQLCNTTTKSPPSPS